MWRREEEDPIGLTLPLTHTRVWRREEEDIRLATMPFLTAENDVRTHPANPYPDPNPNPNRE